MRETGLIGCKEKKKKHERKALAKLSAAHTHIHTHTHTHIYIYIYIYGTFMWCKGYHLEGDIVHIGIRRTR